MKDEVSKMKFGVGDGSFSFGLQYQCDSDVSGPGGASHETFA